MLSLSRSLVLILIGSTLLPACDPGICASLDGSSERVTELQEPDAFEIARSATLDAPLRDGSAATDVEVSVDSVDQLHRYEEFNCDGDDPVSYYGQVNLRLATADGTIEFEHQGEVQFPEGGTATLMVLDGWVDDAEATLPEPPEGTVTVGLSVQTEPSDGRATLVRSIQAEDCSSCETDDEVLGWFSQSTVMRP